MPRRRTRSPEGQKFGDVIRRMRSERRMSQEALAEAADISADYLGFIERGENVATFTVILKLARALNVDAAELFAEFTLPTLKRMKL